jgi:hypothetical protein
MKIFPGLLRLPNELLTQILTETRPDAFESFMLTRKQVFLAGTHLIQSHNATKRWLMNDTPSLYAQGEYDIRRLLGPCCNVTELLKDLPDQRPDLQKWLPEYCSNLSVGFHLTLFERDSCFVEFIQNWQQKLPLVLSRLEAILSSHSFLKKIFESGETTLSDLPVDRSLNDDDENDDPDDDMEPYWEEDRLFHADNLLKTLAIMTLPNLKQLSEREDCYVDGLTRDLHSLCDVLLNIICADLDQKAFQQLEMLVLQSDTSKDLLDMCAFTVLPKLRCLKVAGMITSRYSDPHLDPMRSRILSITNKSSLELVVLSNARLTPDHLLRFLWRIQALRSLTLQLRAALAFQDWDKIYGSMYGRFGRPDPRNLTSVRDSRGRTVDAAKIRAYRDYCVGEGTLKMRRIQAALLEYHQMSHGSLRQLSLTMTPMNGNPQIKPGDLIIDLKAFEGLTHLEISSTFLKRAISDHKSQSYEFCSLHNVLPVSVEVVRLMMETKAPSAVKSLLEPISRHRKTVLALREVYLLLPKDKTRSSRTSHSRQPRQEVLVDKLPDFVVTLKEQLSRVGIRLVIEYYGDPSRVKPVEASDIM